MRYAAGAIAAAVALRSLAGFGFNTSSSGGIMDPHVKVRISMG